MSIQDDIFDVQEVLDDFMRCEHVRPAFNRITERLNKLEIDCGRLNKENEILKDAIEIKYGTWDDLGISNRL
jgi:hypothetical protein